MAHATEGRDYYCDVCIDIGKESYYTEECIDWDDLGMPVKRMSVDVYNQKKLSGDYNVVITKQGDVSLFRRPEDSDDYYKVDEANYVCHFENYKYTITDEDCAWKILGYKDEEESDEE